MTARGRSLCAFRTVRCPRTCKRSQRATGSALGRAWRSSFCFQAEDGIRDLTVTGVQTCALPISPIDARIAGIQAWLDVRLQHKDLVVVGFWSDWAYLNDALVACVGTGTPARIIVVEDRKSVV